MDKGLVDVYANQQDLEIVDGCLLYKNRVVIPGSLKKEILKLLHGNHGKNETIRETHSILVWHKFGYRETCDKLSSLL